MITRLPGRDAHDADDELRDHHACATEDEDLAAAEAFDDVEGEGGGEDVDEGCDEGDEEGIFDCAEGLEEYDLHNECQLGGKKGGWGRTPK